MPQSLSFQCPQCGLKFRVHPEHLGKVAACPGEGCGQKIRLGKPVATSVGKSNEPARQPGRSSKPAQWDASESGDTVANADPNATSTPSHQVEQRSRSEIRKARRATRRRAESARPKPAVAKPKPPLNPLWLGFGSVVVIAAVGWCVWLMMQDDGQKTGANAATVRANSGPQQAVLVNASKQTPSKEEEAKKRREAQRQQTQQRLVKKITPYLNNYCSDCHGPETEDAGINIAVLKTPESLFDQREQWEKIYRMINAGAMPPSDHDPQPADTEREEIATILHDELFNFDCELVYNPGRTTVQRLNRTEYNNTIQDLFGIDLTPAENFPADDVGEGFDNIGDVLSLPPLLMEKYLDAAEQVANAVIDTSTADQRTIAPLNDTLLTTNGQKGRTGQYLVLASHGEVIGKFDVPATGEYKIVVTAKGDQAGDEKVRFTLNQKQESLAEFSVVKQREAEVFEHTMNLRQGRRELSVEFINDYYAEGVGDRNLHVKEISVVGPLNGTGKIKRNQIHRQFVTAEPGPGLKPIDAAKEVLAPTLKRAFRRGVSSEEVLRYSRLVETAMNGGETYEVGLSLALQTILVSPDFLFRLELEPSGSDGDVDLNDYEVASRLSYFLWSSMPDDQLFQLAAEGQLKKPEVLREQVKRMLQDQRSRSLVDNFASQWLNLRNLDEIQPNTDVFKTFNDDLRSDMRQETEMLFETIVKEDRSLDAMLDADFTFVNKRLAEHYGIEGIDSKEFQRVSLAGTQRSGVLTHASILTLTSNPGRTSPVKRGKWIMENIFGDAPPPPPPGVPELEETAEAQPDASLREQLAKHREDPGCAACHKVMDPLGLGLENFDAIGRYRTEDDGRPIDSSGELPSGETFQGPLQLLKVVQSRREKFRRTFAEKLMVYAIGRGARYYDRCAVDECLKQAAGKSNRFSAFVEAIVVSDPFLKRRTVTEDKVARR